MLQNRVGYAVRVRRAQGRPGHGDRVLFNRDLFVAPFGPDISNTEHSVRRQFALDGEVIVLGIPGHEFRIDDIEEQ